MYMHVHVYYMHVQQMTVKVHTNGHTQLQGDEECNLDKQHVYITPRTSIQDPHFIHVFLHLVHIHAYMHTCTCIIHLVHMIYKSNMIAMHKVQESNMISLLCQL